MSNATADNLDSFYGRIQQAANLRTPQHAQRWTTGVLRTLGPQLDGGTKRALAKALPKALGNDLKGVFWLMHFRNGRLSAYDFQRQAGLRSGHSDAQFAQQPVMAVFGAVKQLIDGDLNDRVAKTLPAAVADLWKES
jgi:uncharacterized protein (DUF2267 family)